MAANTCIILNQKADGTGAISMRIGNTSVSVCFEELTGRLNEFGDPKIALTESNLDCVNLSIQTYTANPWRYESTPELIEGAIEGCIEELLRQQEPVVQARFGSRQDLIGSGTRFVKLKPGSTSSTRTASACFESTGRACSRTRHANSTRLVT